MPKEFVIPSVFTAVDKFSGVVSKMEKSVNKFSSNTEKKLARLERKWSKVGDKAKKLGRSSLLFAAALIAPMGLLVNEAVKFESSMSNISTLIDTNVENIDEMGSKVLDLAKKIPVPIEEMTAALYDIRSAGVDASQAMGVLEASSMLAVAGLGSVQEATDLTTSAMNAFAQDGLEVTQITDILFKTVKAGKTNVAALAQAFGATAPIVASAGVKLVDFMAATSALTTLGTPAAQAQNQMKAAIASMQGPTADMIKIYEKLGVTSEKELIAKEGSVVGAFTAINDAASVLDIRLKKAWGSTEALGAVLSLTGPTNAAYTATLKDMSEGSNAVTEAFNKQLTSGKSQAQLAKNNMKALSIQLGQTLIPLLNDLMKAISPILDSFGKWVKANKPLVASIFKGIAGVAAFSAVLGVVSFAVAGFAKVVTLARYALIAFNVMMNIAKLAMLANPFGLLLIGIIAVGAAMWKLTHRTKEQTRQQKLFNDIKQTTIDNAAQEIVETKLLFSELKRLDAGSAAYNATLEKLEQMQPGIIEKYDLQTGAAKSLAAAERELTKNILERAAAQAVAEKLTETMKDLVTLQLEGPTEVLGDAEIDRQIHKQKMLEKQAQMNDLVATQSMLEQGGFDDLIQGNVPKVNTDIVKTETATNTSNLEKNEVVIDFKNVPVGTEISQSGGGSISMPNVGTTN